MLIWKQLHNTPAFLSKILLFLIHLLKKKKNHISKYKSLPIPENKPTSSSKQNKFFIT